VEGQLLGGDRRHELLEGVGSEGRPEAGQTRGEASEHHVCPTREADEPGQVEDGTEEPVDRLGQ
jgi:hypothetical protein